ncbi:MAG: WD40 repeat domain-containing protein, partial [Helicobacter sp.]|nr:WD40 repeat domain-containing protein [Helicobacter sp.]
MFPIQTQLRIVGSALAISTDEHSIICVDNFYNIYTFLLKNKIVDKTLQLSKTIDPLYRFSKAVGISKKKSRIAIGFAKSAKGLVLTTEPNISAVAPLKWGKLEISRAAFSDQERYLATGGEDGRVLIYFGEQYNLLCGLSPLPDTISALCFSEDEVLLFVGCYDKSVVIFNTLKNILIVETTFDSVIEDAFFYDNDTKIFCITRDGKIIVYDFLNRELLNENTLQSVWPTVCQKLLDRDFVLVGARDKVLRIVHLPTNTLMDSIAMAHTGITSFHINGGMLYIGYSDGAIEMVDMDAGKEEFLKALEENDLKAAIKIIQDQNIFLKTLPEYITKVESLWKDVLKEAIDLLAKDKIEEAVELVEPFMSYRAKREEFDYYWQQKEYVAKFMDFIDKKDYVKAYALLDKYPYLKNTIVYENIEIQWERLFRTAEDLLIKDPALNLPKARKLLEPYANVQQKRQVVTMLLHNTDKFAQANNDYKARKFAEYFRICERYPFLRQTTTYKNALYIGEQILERVSALENQRQYPKAIEMCNLLISMAPFVDIGNAKLKSIEGKHAFIQAYEKNDLKVAFELAEKHYELHSLLECKKLYEDFRDKAQIAFEAAVQGKGLLV